MSLLQEAIPYLEQIGDWQEWVLAKVSLAISLAAQGHYREGRAQGEEGIGKALELNDMTSIASARGMTARVEFMAGDLQRMLDETRVVVQEAQSANPLVSYMVLGFQAWGEGRLGMYDLARATMDAAGAVAARVGTRLIFADWFAAARAEIEFNAGQIDRALELAEQAVEDGRATGGIISEGIAQRVWGQALAARNGPEDAEAEAHLETSLRLFEEGEAAIEAARTRVALGQLMQARGDIKSAREHLERAAAQFKASGLDRELERTVSLIDATTD